MSEFGSETYVYIGKHRYRTGEISTIKPTAGETEADFVARIDRLVHRLHSYRVLRCVTRFERRDGKLSHCVIELTHAPEYAPLTNDRTPTARRFGQRGKRGNGKRAA